MQSILPGPCEVVVSSVHGNGAFPDGEHSVNISHSSLGAVITPRDHPPSASVSTLTSPDQRDMQTTVGKVHYVLPTLRAAEEETPGGKLTGYAIASIALELSVSPYHIDSQKEITLAPNEGSEITRVELYAGRDCLKSWDREGGEQQLPSNRDLKLHVHCDIVGQGDSLFNENPKGLGVTLTIEFRGETAALLVSSVALVQIVGSRGKQSM